MKNERRATVATPQTNTATKIHKIKGIEKVIGYFRYKMEGSTLSIADATGVSRCSVCYYLRDLITLGIVGLVGRKRGRTGRLMKMYSTDKGKWIKNAPAHQLSLFPDYEEGGQND